MRKKKARGALFAEGQRVTSTLPAPAITVR